MRQAFALCLTLIGLGGLSVVRAGTPVAINLGMAEFPNANEVTANDLHVQLAGQPVVPLPALGSPEIPFSYDTTQFDTLATTDNLAFTISALTTGTGVLTGATSQIMWGVTGGPDQTTQPVSYYWSQDGEQLGSVYLLPQFSVTPNGALWDVSLFNPTASPIDYTAIMFGLWSGYSGTPTVTLGPGTLDPGGSLFVATGPSSIFYAVQMGDGFVLQAHLDPVPEPAAFALVGGGLMVCLSLVRRRVRARRS